MLCLIYFKLLLIKTLKGNWWHYTEDNSKYVVILKYKIDDIAKICALESASISVKWNKTVFQIRKTNETK